MGKRKKKIILNEKASEEKKAFQIPVAPAGFTYPDKTKYSRRKKHKKSWKSEY